MHKLIKTKNGKRYIVNIPDYNDYGYGMSEGAGPDIFASVSGSMNWELTDITWENENINWELA